MKDNLVSIIIPAYNCERYIHECLDSILGQTYSNIEVIAVDDGSTDNTFKILEESAETDSRLSVFRRMHQGAAAARNFALHQSSGEFIMFVDADDFISPNAIEILHKILTSTGADIIKAHYSYFYDNGHTLKSIFKSRWPRKQEVTSREARLLMLRQKFSSSACGKLYRRSAIREDISFGKGMTFNEDFHFLWQLYHHPLRIILHPQEIYSYRQHEHSVTAGFNPAHLELLPYLDSLPTNGTSEKQSLEIYKNSRFSHIVYTMRRAGAHKEYRKAYKALCTHLRKNFLKILFNPGYHFRDRVKGLIGAFQGW